MLVIRDFNRRAQPGNDLEPDLSAVRLFRDDRQFLSRGKIRFFRRMLAKVPRIITSWLPRLAP